MTAKKFRNFSDKDFEWTFNSIPYVFKAGSETYVEEDKAALFAKHLINRELDRKNIPTSNQSERDKLWQYCFPSDIHVTPAEAVDIEAKKSEVSAEITKEKSRGGPEKVIEEEFAELKKT